MYLDKLTITNRGDGMVTLAGRCIITGKPYSVTAKFEEVAAYQQGALAQNAFPNMSPDEREFLITGTSPEGWNQMFGEEEED